MDKAALVATDLAIGEEIVKALDRTDLAIKVALWLYADEYPDWRFVLASRRLDAAGVLQAYGLVHDALSAVGISLAQTPALMILSMSNPFIEELRRVFSKTKSVAGMRLGGQTIGNRFVESAIAYVIR